jgi:hypothetical protein
VPVLLPPRGSEAEGRDAGERQRRANVVRL